MQCRCLDVRTYAQIKGKKGAPANHDLLHTILAVPREPRRRHDVVSLFRVQQFWLEHCAPSPNSCVQKLNEHTRVLTLRPIHYQRHSTPQLWRAYTLKGGDLLYALFCALKPTHAKDHHHQSCLCPHYVEGKIAKDMVAYFNRISQERPLSVEQKKKLSGTIKKWRSGISTKHSPSHRFVSISAWRQS